MKGGKKKKKNSYVRKGKVILSFHFLFFFFFWVGMEFELRALCLQSRNFTTRATCLILFFHFLSFSEKKKIMVLQMALQMLLYAASQILCRQDHYPLSQHEQPRAFAACLVSSL
jgi:hypothetical protein